MKRTSSLPTDLCATALSGASRSQRAPAGSHPITSKTLIIDLNFFVYKRTFLSFLVIFLLHWLGLAHNKQGKSHTNHRVTGNKTPAQKLPTMNIPKGSCPLFHTRGSLETSWIVWVSPTFDVCLCRCEPKEPFVLYCETNLPGSAAFSNHILHLYSLGCFGSLTPCTAKAQGSSAYGIATHRG